jgi:5-formyltetrahydrofolate cyclo-ligase
MVKPYALLLAKNDRPLKLMLPNPIPSHYEPKKAWRAWAKAQRSFVCSSLEVKLGAEERMVTQLRSFIENNPSIKTIGLYLPLPLEPNLLKLLACFPTKKWAMPRVGNPALGELKTTLFFHQVPSPVVSFIQSTHDAQLPFDRWGLVQNQWGLWESPATWQAINAIDLLIIPALAMDVQGVRLGYGGGYYDRWLASNQSVNAQTIGVCWEACKVEKLPKEALDIPLHGSCTEATLLFVD